MPNRQYRDKRRILMKAHEFYDAHVEMALIILTSITHIFEVSPSVIHYCHY